MKNTTENNLPDWEGLPKWRWNSFTELLRYAHEQSVLTLLESLRRNGLDFFSDINSHSISSLSDPQLKVVVEELTRVCYALRPAANSQQFFAEFEALLKGFVHER